MICDSVAKTVSVLAGAVMVDGWAVKKVVS